MILFWYTINKLSINSNAICTIIYEVLQSLYLVAAITEDV